MDEAFPASRQVKLATRTIGIFFFALAAACAGIENAPPGVVVNTGPPVAVAPVAAPSTDEAVVAGPVPLAAVVAESPSPELPVESAVAPAPPAKSKSTVKVVPPPARAPAKAAAPLGAIEQPGKNEVPPPAAKTLEPALDVAGLTARLRDTKAIGVFTKLALKNQVDDLLKQFRAHYQSGQKTGVASLRQPYDMLILKVLALLQDSDPPLARTISGSREAIWGILADPEKFNSIA